MQLASPPATLPAKPQTIFAEHFTGNDLGSAWEVINRNPDNYIVEGGNLLIVARTPGGFGNDKAANIFRLTKPMPDGNWGVTVRFAVEFQTLRESLFVGLMDDAQNYLAAQLYSRSVCCDTDLILRIVKVSGGQTTEFTQSLPPTKSAAQPLALRLRKDGHEFRAGISFAGQPDKDGNPVWIETGSVTSLRPPKSFALNASQWEQTTGESPFRISAVTIEAPGR